MVLAFYLVAIVILIAAAMVVIARSPVHAVLWLILAFLSAVVLFVLLGAEFLAFLLMVVYVGAVAVLFLFVVMLLDVDFAELKEGALKNIWLGLFVAVILALELFVVAGSAGEVTATASLPFTNAENTYQLGAVLYDDFAFVFLGAGMVLFVALIGAIVLTLDHRTDVKRQNVVHQMHRDPKAAMELVDVKSGQGLSS